MSLKAPESQKFTPPTALEPATYPARIVRVLDLGLQAQVDFTTKEPKRPVQMISVTYEFVDVFLQDDEGNDQEDKPRWLSEEFPLHALSSDLAKSTKRMKAVDPSGELDGDWSQTLSRPLMVTTGNYEDKQQNTRDKVLNVSTARKRDVDSMPPLKNPAVFFDLSAPDLEVFNSLPKWQQDKIKGNLAFDGSPLDRALGGKAVDKPTPAAKKAVTKAEPKVEGNEPEDAPW